MLLFYSHTITPRLQYIINFFSAEITEEPIRISTDPEEYREFRGPRINYTDSDFNEEEFYIQPHSLLFEQGIRGQLIECFELNFHKAFFATRGDFPFDIFAASFYLLSRYEEYLPFQPDEYGRYPYRDSLAFREGFLKQPLVNIWLNDFQKALRLKFPDLNFRRRRFRVLLTYDIDMAWAYLHKGFWRNAGGLLRSLASGNWKETMMRLYVWRGGRKDPYDCFEWLDALHLYCRLKPCYFFLVAGKRGKYDKNIPTRMPAFRSLIEYNARHYPVGLHPSWQSGDQPALLKEEKEWLEAVADIPVRISRQHYIRMNLPRTYRQLLSLGFEKDFSMGYGSVNGFRASTCSAFYWYDLEQEKQTRLQLNPFCFMDANSYFEQKDGPARAYAELTGFYQQVKSLEGVMISIWHNNILGTHPDFSGWREMFELFMKETVYWDAYYDAG